MNLPLTGQAKPPLGSADLRSPYQLDPAELDRITGEHAPYRVDQLREWLYQHPVLTADQMTNLPADIRRSLADRVWPFGVEMEQTADYGRTRKWLFRSSDGASIETVLMGYPNRTTLCISSQAGCAMACTFCATGQFGFERHLDAGEIFAQVAFANATLRADPIEGSPARVTNVVFMGMGEPLANYGNVKEALARMIDLANMAARSITVSTVGHVPGMRRLAAEGRQVSLAVSLHATDDELRTSLVPLNDRYPIEAVLAAARYYFERTGRRISIEWTLMAGVNDDAEQARRLAEIAVGLRAHINVIALNPTPLTPYEAPTHGAISAFMDALATEGAHATFRETRGREIDAACGQLRVRSLGGKTTETGTEGKDQ
ncbi:MAG: 23S rRNA (adenine(2503)-C(2))-methyltransferase RlmN [Acidimicrobiia bacterium]|nr:23S rRNA (adenine(2503)-C(2))-methyltransferase RlmN [Acidimicrobiia bacterium]